MQTGGRPMREVGRPAPGMPAITHPPPAEPYRPLERLGYAVVALLTANVVLDVAAVIADLSLLDLVERVREGASVTLEEADQVESSQGTIERLQGAAFILAAIPFFAWFRRAYRNLGGLGVQRLRYKPGWAIGGWFVPVLGLVRPKQITNDIWRATAPGQPARLDAPPQHKRPGPIVQLWWGLFLLSGLLYQSGSGALDAPTLGELRYRSQATLWADVTSALAGVFAILVVRAITIRQQLRSAIVGAAPREPDMEEIA